MQIDWLAGFKSRRTEVGKPVFKFAHGLSRAKGKRVKMYCNHLLAGDRIDPLARVPQRFCKRVPQSPVVWLDRHRIISQKK